jgi:hypothetical protein
MVYVAVGQLVAFATFLFLGLRAVTQSTELVFDERLAIAQNVVATLGQRTRVQRLRR